VGCGVASSFMQEKQGMSLGGETRNQMTRLSKAGMSANPPTGWLRL